ncbi:MAG: GH92 family glycosyl hydrolase [Bacteroidales bacterium]
MEKLRGLSMAAVWQVVFMENSESRRYVHQAIILPLLAVWLLLNACDRNDVQKTCIIPRPEKVYEFDPVPEELNKEMSGSVSLRKGYHDLTLTCFEHSGNEFLNLRWSGPEMPKEPILPDNFILPGIHQYTRYVDPFIGTDGHGHTFPGAAVPFGMVQVGPDTRKDSWDGCSGYHYSDSSIMGFSMTHLSGTGVGDYGDFRFMPLTGDLHFDPGDPRHPGSGYRSRFDHSGETAAPGHYHVFLTDYDVSVDLTATTRAGMQKYIFPQTAEAYVLVDLKESITSERVIHSEFRIVSDTEIEGYRQTSGWADNQYLYFFAEFSRPFDSAGIVREGERVMEKYASGEHIKAFMQFDAMQEQEVTVKIGVSSVSTDNARKNLRSEIPDFNFEKIRLKAMLAWSRELSKIEVGGAPEHEMIKFYSALYHAFLAPNTWSDVDGRYRGHDMEIHRTGGFTMHTVFSLWDTFRALHPLFTIIQREKTEDLILSMMDIYDKGGLLPVWELAANETWCMIGYHSIPVIVDAWIKGIRGFDAEKALDAMIKSAEQDHHGLEYYKQYGYIPAGKEGESVSKTLEYAYDDWCIATMAGRLGRDGDHARFIRRAQYYKNLYDPETGFMRGKVNGMFAEPFDPTEVNFMLTEANTWQYTFFVPQDVKGLIKLMGGDKAFNAKLDEMFNASHELSGRRQADITGLIGQYAHGNEPSHHMAYLYCFSGQPWKTQALVRKIMRELYTQEPDGLCGNEDCGQLSAWYVLSAMGFYPLLPGSSEYVMGSPVFKSIKIHLETGDTFEIRAKNNSRDRPYISSAQFNGKCYENVYITHEQIMSGGLLELTMSAEPEKERGTAELFRPHSEITEHLITPVPYFRAPGRSFAGETEVSLGSVCDNAGIYYTCDGSDPVKQGMEYAGPLSFDQTTTIKAWAVKEGLAGSQVVEGTFNKYLTGRTLRLNTGYSSQYAAGGDQALIDQLRGGDDFRTGFWQGYYGVDLDVVLDLGEICDVQNIGVGFLQDIGSWIFMPEKVLFYISGDDDRYRLLGSVENDIDERETGAITRDFMLEGLHERGRYINVVARNRGICPEWHKGAGSKAWIFADEIWVNE